MQGGILKSTVVNHPFFTSSGWKVKGSPWMHANILPYTLQFPLSRLPVTLSGMDNAACGQIKIAGIHVLAHGLLLEEQLFARAIQPVRSEELDEVFQRHFR